MFLESKILVEIIILSKYMKIRSKYFWQSENRTSIADIETLKNGLPVHLLADVNTNFQRNLTFNLNDYRKKASV